MLTYDQSFSLLFRLLGSGVRLTFGEIRRLPSSFSVVAFLIRSSGVVLTVEAKALKVACEPRQVDHIEQNTAKLLAFASAVEQECGVLDIVGELCVNATDNLSAITAT
jgi:hypothetical protein